MIDYTISYDTENDDVTKLHEALYQYNIKQLGCEYRKKTVLISAYTAKQFIAGVEAVLSLGYIYIDKLWVHEDYRKQGVGKILMQKIENTAKQHDINYIQLQTGTFQEGLAFYERLGYRVFAEYPIKYNKNKYTAYMLEKYI